MLPPPPSSSFWLYSPGGGSIDGYKEYLLDEILNPEDVSCTMLCCGGSPGSAASQAWVCLSALPEFSHHILSRISHLHHSVNEPMGSSPKSRHCQGRRTYILSALEGSTCRVLDLYEHRRIQTGSFHRIPSSGYSGQNDGGWKEGTVHCAG